MNFHALPSSLAVPRLTRRSTILGVSGALLNACRNPADDRPSIEFTRVPQADRGGREKHDIIEGRVIGAQPGQQVVLYSRSGLWWVQPLVAQPFTRIQKNSKFSNATHLGTEYAALLVNAGYHPPPTLAVLPPVDGAIAAVAVVTGAASAPSPTIRFCGYEWRVRDAPSSRGGGNDYDSSNAWTDGTGALHLRIANVSGKWTCAEVSLTRSLGYGTYSFSAQDTGGLQPAAVFGMFTWDYSGADQNNREMDIEVSRFGDPSSKNLQYVVQPYFIATNVQRFTIPSGPLTHSFRWEAGRVTFRTVRGLSSATRAPVVAEQVFTSGIPSHGIESVRMNLYIYHNAKIPFQNGAEVVIEKFEYLP